MITTNWETLASAPRNGALFILYLNEPDAGFFIGTATFVKDELIWLDNEKHVTIDGVSLFLWSPIPTSI